VLLGIAMTVPPSAHRRLTGRPRPGFAGTHPKKRRTLNVRAAVSHVRGGNDEPGGSAAPSGFACCFKEKPRSARGSCHTLHFLHGAWNP